jgi:glycosyltransferase involved in cell wall biosynthesis
MTTAPTFTVVIPAYNEETGIGQTLAELCQALAAQPAEIIVVDDGSDDQTAARVAQFPSVHLARHKANRGYSAAIATGTRLAQGRYVIWYDADGQHRPQDLIRVAQTLIDNDLEYCIGVRDSQSYDDPRRRLGKFILRLVVKVAVDQPVQDFNSGLRGFRKDVLLRYLHLLPRGFGASTMTTLLMLERGHFGEEVPITVRRRIGTSSVRQVHDGMKTLMIILRIFLLFKPMLFFGSIGGALIIGGSIYGFAEAISLRQGFPVFGALIIILGVQSLFFGLLNDQISLLRRERFTDDT